MRQGRGECDALLYNIHDLRGGVEHIVEHETLCGDGRRDLRLGRSYRRITAHQHRRGRWRDLKDNKRKVSLYIL